MKLRVLVVAVAVALVAVPPLATKPTPAGAHHSWGSYHWARTAGAFALQVGDNVASVWDPYLDEAIRDWNASEVLDLAKVAGKTTSRQCRAPSGRVEVCASRYGVNGWLGLAQIWISGSHITQGTAKMNDSYFSTATYNTPAWRRLVMCQEIAHAFGLGHQNEIFDNPNVGSCMDYTNDPTGKAGTNGTLSNEHPNSHDFEQLVTIYTHRDSTTTVAQAAGSSAGGQATDDAEPGRSGTAGDEGPNNPADFGRPTGHRDGYGRDSLFEKDQPGGKKLFTHVFWVHPGEPGAPERKDNR